MATCKVHNVRFYKPPPKAIYCMALDRNNKKLAVSRSDGCIEIWNLQHCPYIERTIVNSPENCTIQDLTWCGDHLFSVGLHGFLIEYDLHDLATKQTISVTGEAAFCIDADRTATHLAIGTEQGYLNIFSVTEDGILFDKFLDKQEGKILCLKYDSTGNYIVSGSVDAIRIWDVATGHALHRMTTGRSETNKETIVWCLDVTDDFTIISGDSRGKLTFWDGKIGAQIESYQSHRADILTLCLSKDQRSLYCAGVDPLIVEYVKVNFKKSNDKWVKSIQRKVHDHDVRSLILCGNKLYSGGIDGYLACTYHPPKTLIKYPPILQSPCVTVCKQARYILLRYPTYIEVWHLGKSTGKQNNSAILSSENKLQKLLTLQRLVKVDDREVKEGIICATMSHNGKWILFSTDSVLRLFMFNYTEGNKPELMLIEGLPEECSISLQAIFMPDSSHLILATRDCNLQFISLDRYGPMLVQTVLTSAYLTDTIAFLILSPCGQYLIAADTESNIGIWVFVKKSWQKYCKLPHYSCPPTALSVQNNSLNLVVIYSDHKIIEYDIRSRKFTKFSRLLNEQHSKRWLNKSIPIRNITFDPRSKDILLLQDDANIVVINKAKKLPETDSKIPKIDSLALSDSNDGTPFKSHKHACHVIKKYKHLVHLEWLSNDELVVVEVSPLSLMEDLPPCLKQNTFGTK